MPTPSGSLINHLPAIFRTSATSGHLRELLAVFEQVLLTSSGQDLHEKQQQSLEEKIANVASLFDVFATPKEFLPWLSQWVGLTQFNWLEEKRRRQLLAQIVPLYATRGTKQYVEKLLDLIIPEPMHVLIDDQVSHGFRVGTVHLGIDSWLDHDKPFWFQVKITMAADGNSPTITDFKAYWEPKIRHVVDLGKPAHTVYDLYWNLIPPREDKLSRDISVAE